MLFLINDIESLTGDSGSENLQLAWDIRLAYEHKSIIPRLEGLYKRILRTRPTLEVPYDPYVPSSYTDSRAQNLETAALQAEFDSIVGIMHDNINKLASAATCWTPCKTRQTTSPQPRRVLAAERTEPATRCGGAI